MQKPPSIFALAILYNTNSLPMICTNYYVETNTLQIFYINISRNRNEEIGRYRQRYQSSSGALGESFTFGVVPPFSTRNRRRAILVNT